MSTERRPMRREGRPPRKKRGRKVILPEESIIDPTGIQAGRTREERGTNSSEVFTGGMHTGTRALRGEPGYNPDDKFGMCVYPDTKNN